MRHTGRLLLCLFISGACSSNPRTNAVTHPSVIASPPLPLHLFSNITDIVPLAPTGIGVETGYEFPYPAYAVAASSRQKCDQLRGLDEPLHNSGQTPANLLQIPTNIVGFMFGVARPPGWQDLPAGFHVSGESAPACDEGYLAVLFVDPIRARNPREDVRRGSNEYGLTRSVSDQNQHLIFYQVYSAKIPSCELSKSDDLTALGFEPERTGTCFAVQVQPTGTYQVSQYLARDRDCAVVEAIPLHFVTISNISITPPSDHIADRANCPYPITDINFYSGHNTHNPGNRFYLPPQGTAGVAFIEVVKSAGATNIHHGTRLSGWLQLYQLPFARSAAEP